MKHHVLIEAYGTVDELSSQIGLVTVHMKSPTERTFLLEIQKDLYTIMGILALAHSPIDKVEDRTNLFEQKIDKFTAELPKLNRFVLPGGTELSAHFHIARTICRRAERRVVEAFHLEISNKELPEETKGIVVQYLNRLSDLLFTYARQAAEGKEQKT